MTWHGKKYLKNYIVDNERKVTRDVVWHKKLHSQELWIQVYPWENLSSVSNANFRRYGYKWFISKEAYTENYPSNTDFGDLAVLLIKKEYHLPKWYKVVRWILKALDLWNNRNIKPELKIDFDKEEIKSLKQMCKSDKEYKRKYFTEEE